MSCVPQRSVLGQVLYNGIVGNMDNGTECTLSKLVNDTRLSSAIDTPEGRDAFQWDLDTFER